MNTGVSRAEIDARLRVLLPPEYHDTYQQLSPTPMRSAGLTFATDGRVAWNRIWQSFCDLAIAGGPPHKGRLLGPGAVADIADAPDAQLDVLDELARGLTMASELPTGESPHLGWIRVTCHSDVMAGWMHRAITAENVAVRREGRHLDLPAAPGFRVEKEIKNVVTVVAKTTHYWMRHVPREQRITVGELLARMDADAPLLEPRWNDAGQASWWPTVCEDVHAALRLMQALLAVNVLARREDTTLLVAVDSIHDADGRRREAALKWARSS